MALRPCRRGTSSSCWGGLVDRSFVTVNESHGEMRYRLLETVREYAARKLAEGGERSDLQARHGDWFARRAVSVGEEIFAERQLLSLWGGDALASEAELVDDLLAATEWAFQEGIAPPAMLPIATIALLRVSGRVAEAIALADRVDVDAMDDRERALLKMGLASSLTHRGDFRAAYGELQEVGRVRLLPRHHRLGHRPRYRSLYGHQRLRVRRTLRRSSLPRGADLPAAVWRSVDGTPGTLADCNERWSRVSGTLGSPLLADRDHVDGDAAGRPDVVEVGSRGHQSVHAAREWSFGITILPFARQTRCGSASTTAAEGVSS